MFHHSFPGITEQLTKTSQIKDFVKVSFLIAGTTMLSIPITAVMAFGNDLV
jgi:predicted membrane channel-forming protein YqfA (hemolysin III family)